MPFDRAQLREWIQEEIDSPAPRPGDAAPAH
jgi:hypothetical protein